MSKKKLTKHIWYGSDTVMSDGKLQAAPPPVAIDDGSEEWHLSGLTRGELFVNDYAGDPALFILASDNTVRRIGGQGSGGGGEGGGGDFSLVQGPGIEIESDINNIYTISHKDTSSQESINKTKKKGIASVLLDDFGHVTGLDTCDILDLEDLDKRYLRKDIDDMAEGNILFKQKIGSDIFLDGMDGKGWEIKADGSGIMEALRVRSDIFAGNKIGSISFAPGFTGWGTEIDIPTATGTFDNIFARKTFTAYEIVYSQIYGLGGSQIVSDINKIGRVERLSDRWRCYMDDMDGLMLMNLREGDGVRIQRRNGITSTKYLFGRCIGISSDYFDVAYPLIEGTGEPEVGDFAMRWGNDRDTTRQGLIYLTTADQGAPYIAVYDGITGVSTQDTLKAQLGNLSMIRTKNGTQLKGYGAYLNGVYIENSSIYLDNGNTVEQQFYVMNGELNSKIEGIRNDMSLESGNILVNSSFGTDTNYWAEENQIHFINVSGNLLWVGGAFYSDKRKVADIYRDGGRNVLRIKDTYISQRNDVMKVPDLEESEEGHTFSFSLFYKVVRRGVLTVGFQGQELYDSLTLDPSDEYVKLSKAGKWDGTGDFRIGFTGEILIYGVSLFNDRLADAVIKLETRILQTEEYIKLLATKDYVDSETGKIYEKYTGELSVMATEIAARVTHTEFDTETAAIRREVSSALTVQDGKISGISTDVNNIQNTIDTAGWINTTQGNALFAAKSLEDGNKIISYINQTATTTTIKAERINLVGAVTFSMFNTSLQGTINGKANSIDLGDLAYSNYISYEDLTSGLQDILDNKATSTDITNALKSYVTSTQLSDSLANYEKTGTADAAMEKLADAIVNGKTSILGGLVSTSLLDADEIIANAASVGGFRIESGGLFSENYTTGYSNGKFFLHSGGQDGFLGFSATGLWSGIGLNTLPGTLGGIRSLARFENSISTQDIKYGIYVRVQNGGRNIAVSAIGDMLVKGAVYDAHLVTWGPSSTGNTLPVNRGTRFEIYTSSYTTIYLPTRSEIASSLGISSTDNFSIVLYIWNRWSAVKPTVFKPSGMDLFNAAGESVNSFNLDQNKMFRVVVVGTDRYHAFVSWG